MISTRWYWGVMQGSSGVLAVVPTQSSLAPREVRYPIVAPKHPMKHSARVMIAISKCRADRFATRQR